MRRHSRGGLRVAWATSLLFFALCAFATAQDTALEKFEAVDPYTKGDKAAMAKLGVLSFGPFHWADAHTSETVREALGGSDVLFVETAHFRIASTLETYKAVEDTQEKKFIEAELAALKKLGLKCKGPSKLDPWLRVHLYAQRLESVYASFCARFALKDTDFTDLDKKQRSGLRMGVGPYLGQREKFTVLLTETRSALGRYLRAHCNVDNEYSYRHPFGDSWFFGANFEALKDGNRALDVALYAAVASAVSQNLLDGSRASQGVAPDWLRYGLAHVFARDVDPRWNQWNAGGDADPDDKKSWDWRPRVRGLVDNDVVPSWEAMHAWLKYEDIKPREHMIAWSRVEWLLSRPENERRAAFMAVTHSVEGFGEARAKVARPTQQLDLNKALGMEAAAMDSTWRKWVLATYGK